MRSFRFGCSLGAVSTRSGWLEQVRRCEELGYSTVFVSDHFSDKLAPLPALAVAAEHTGMNVGTFVLANDFRHPAVLAKEAATVDVLSDGRLELGIGTGWDEADYAASGIDRPSPGDQVGRLEEAVEVLRGLWAESPLAFDGDHYSVDLNGQPKPVSPKLLIGGGGPRMLSLAGREADIVGISAAGITHRQSLKRGITGAGASMDNKVAVIRQAAGPRFDRLELNMLLFGVELGERDGTAEKLAREWSATPEAVLESPHFLAGSVDQVAADLEERRRRWGISYWVVGQSRMEMMAPVVARLSGN